MQATVTTVIYANPTTRKISRAITNLEIRLEDLHIEATRLQALDPVRATPHYHKDAHGEPRYLYLIHPQRNGERVREYIGSKPDRIEAALIRVQAHRDLAEVLRQAADIRSRLGLVARYLQAALRAAKGGKD